MFFFMGRNLIQSEPFNVIDDTIHHFQNATILDLHNFIFFSNRNSSSTLLLDKLLATAILESLLNLNYFVCIYLQFMEI